jgi:hypothetical protein
MRALFRKSLGWRLLLGMAQGAGWLVFVLSIFIFYLVPPFAGIWVGIRLGVWVGGTSGVAIGLISMIALTTFAGSLQDRELGTVLARWGDRCAGFIDRLSIIQTRMGRIRRHP